MFSDQYLAITQITRQVALLYTPHTLNQSALSSSHTYPHTHVHFHELRQCFWSIPGYRSNTFFSLRLTFPKAHFRRSQNNSCLTWDCCFDCVYEIDKCSQMQNDSLRTLFLYRCVVRMSHKNTKHFSPGGNSTVSARERNTQQTKCAAQDLKLRESSSIKDNLSKCNKGNGVLGNCFPPHIFHYM